MFAYSTLSRFTLRLVGCLLLFPAFTFAQPSDKEPDGKILHHRDEMEKLLTESHGLYLAANRELSTISTKGAKALPKVLGDTLINVRKLSRASTQLLIWHETAGYDYYWRADVLQTQTRELIKRYRETPAGQMLAAKISAELPVRAKARDADLKRIGTLFQQGKLFPAENELYESLDGFELVLAFIDDQARGEFFRPYERALDEIVRRAYAARSELAKTAIRETAAKQVFDYDKLLQEMQSAASALQTRGSAEIGTGTLTGPQLVEHFGKRWVAEHTSHIRRGALNVDQSIDNGGAAMNLQSGTYPRATPEDVDESGVVPRVLAALNGLIEAGANRAAPEEVPELYGAYIKAILPLAPFLGQNELARQLSPGLKKLADKSTIIGPEAAAYHAATTELLRWRSRAAASMAQAKAAGAIQPTPLLRRTATSNKEWTGLYHESDPMQRLPGLFRAVPVVLPTIVSRVQGQNLVVLDVVAIVTSKSKSGISRYSEGTYANVLQPLRLPAPLQQLTNDLMVTEKTPPLSLQAALAMESAKRGDYVSVGGPVEGLRMESMLTRFSTMKEMASVLCKLGVVPSHECSTPQIQRVLVRFDVRPKWVQHQYFCVDVPPEAWTAEEGGGQ